MTPSSEDDFELSSDLAEFSESQAIFDQTISDEIGEVAKNISVLGTAINVRGDRTGILISYASAFGGDNLHVIPLHLLRERKALLSELESKGVQVREEISVDRLSRALRSSAQPLVLLVDREGYVRIPDRDGYAEAYVMGAECFGAIPSTISRVVLNPEVASTYSQQGSLDDWQRGAGIMCKNNPMLICCVAAALSAIPAAILDKATISVALCGSSSSGKTGALRVVDSLTGGVQGIAADGTAKGIDVSIRAVGNRPITIDEMGQAEKAENILNAIYAVGNRSTRVRSTLKGTLDKLPRAEAIIFCAGEVDLNDLPGARGKLRDGHSVRILQLPPDFEYGCFADIQGYEDGGAFSKALENECKSSYGHVWKSFVKAAFNDVAKFRKDCTAQLTKAENLLRQQVRRELPQNLFDRCISAAALWLVACDYAVFRKLVPWSRREVESSIVQCLQAWAQAMAADSPIDRDIIATMRNFLEREKHTSFLSIPSSIDSSATSKNGFICTRHGERYFLIRPEVFRDLYQHTARVPAITALRRAGYLEAATTGGMKEKRLDGEKKYFYFIHEKILKS